MSAHARTPRAAIGLAAGPFAWAVSTQANYVLPDMVCTWPVNPVPWIAAAMVVAALAGALVSWRVWRSTGLDPVEQPTAGRPHHLLAGLGTLTSVLFALAIALQGIAGLVLTGCER